MRRRRKRRPSGSRRCARPLRPRSRTRPSGDAARERLEVDPAPVAGEEVAAIVRNAYATAPEIVARLTEAIKPPR